MVKIFVKEYVVIFSFMKCLARFLLLIAFMISTNTTLAYHFNILKRKIDDSKCYFLKATLSNSISNYLSNVKFKNELHLYFLLYAKKVFV